MFSIFGFYKFKKLNNLKKNKSILQLYMAKHQVKGAVILANEGINGTISGKKKEYEEDYHGNYWDNNDNVSSVIMKGLLQKSQVKSI